MAKDDKESKPDCGILETLSEILGRHGKSDGEIRAFLEEHFPISAAIIDKILEAKKKKNDTRP